MTRRTRLNHSGAFKAKVALAAIKGDRTLSELAQAFDVRANQITQWRTELLEGAASVFDGRAPEANTPAPELKALHAKIGELTLENDFLEGARMLCGLLNGEGLAVGRKHVATLMKKMGIAALYRRPNTSKPVPGHRIYPYLLRQVKVDRPNQAWAMDIT